MRAAALFSRLAFAFTLAVAYAVAATPARAAEGWRWPLRGPVVGAFDYRLAQPFARGQHRGIDIAAPAGTAVRAVCDGQVVFAGTAGSSGRTVSVRCGALIATYLHLGSIAVRTGGTVSAGDRLGRVGTSGQPRLRTAHLHLGARRAASRWGYVDPLALLRGGGRAPDFSPLPGRPRMPAPFAVRMPRGLARAPAPAPWLAPARSPAPIRPLPSAPSPSRPVPWPVWAGAALLAVAVPLPALRWRRRARVRAAGAAARGRRTHRLARLTL